MTLFDEYPSVQIQSLNSNNSENLILGELDLSPSLRFLGPTNTFYSPTYSAGIRRNPGIPTESAGIDRNSGIPADSGGINRNPPLIHYQKI